jgi:intergrase/recombinase
MNLYLIVNDFDLAAKLSSWGFKNFMLYGYRPIQISQANENSKLVCRDELTNQLYVTTKQEYVQYLKLHELPTTKIVLMYEVLIDDGFDWDKAIAHAIGMEEVTGDSTLLVEEISKKMITYIASPQGSGNFHDYLKMIKE